jgi:histidinol-phosphate aminotransferase
VAQRSRKSLPLVVVDEAYYEYARVNKDYPDTLRLMKRYPNLIILRTFSKIYGLAGLRVGYGFADPEIVDYIDRIRPPFNVNFPAQVAAVASLSDSTQVSRSLTLLEQEKLSICRELDRWGIQFVPSAANFVLINISPLKGLDVFKRLLKEGVIVRAMDEYQLVNHIRVTIGTRAQNKMFLAALKKIVA